MLKTQTRIKSIANLEAQVLSSARDYLKNQGFTEIVVPRVVRASGSCENINTLFEVSVDEDFEWFNGKKAYLAQTGQLYLEALVPFMKKVYCGGDSFRAEPKADNRHLTAFYMIEIEFAGNFKKLMQYIEGFLGAIVQDISKMSGQELKKMGLSKARQKELARTKKVFPKITYSKAIKLLQKKGIKVSWGDDITSVQEEILIKHFDNQPLFITHYPDPLWDHGKEIEVEKFFNMIPDPKDPGNVLSSDLILPYAGESVGAAQRVHDIKTLKYRLENSRMFKMLKDKGGSLDDFSWYTNQLRKNGSIPHAGCGFGISRILKWIKASDDIRDCIAFPINRQNLI